MELSFLFRQSSQPNTFRRAFQRRGVAGEVPIFADGALLVRIGIGGMCSPQPPSFMFEFSRQQLSFDGSSRDTSRYL